MQQTDPPYTAGSISIPKQLIRWDDINPIKGPLQRVNTFIIIPSFSEAFTWNGYSDIVASFNYEATNNFSLVNWQLLIPTSPNYMLCVSYRIGNIVTRYSLWRNVGEVIFFSITPYTGQPIKKNFRFEIWSTATSPAINVAPLTFYTSVLGNVDYRFGTDTALVTADNIVTSFGNVNDQSNILPSSIPLFARFNSVGLNPQLPGAGVSWVSTASGTLTFPAGVGGFAVNNAVELIASPVSYTSTGSGYVSGSLSFNNIKLNTIVIGFRGNASVNTQLYSDDANNDLNYDGTSLLLKWRTHAGAIKVQFSGMVNDHWYVVVIAKNNIYLYDMQTAELLQSGTDATTPANAGTLLIGFVSCYIIELFLSATQVTAQDAQNFAQYYASTYFGDSFSLSLNFPSNAVSVTN